MIFAHIPAGYLLTKSLQKKLATQRALWLGLLASVLPDLDIFYFYLIDKQQSHHHTYWIHIPFWWMVIGALVTIISYFAKSKKNFWNYYLIFFLNIFLHLFLDTIVGDILWKYPFSKEMIHFFYIAPHFDFWIWNFVFHWSFLIEIGIIVFTFFSFIRLQRKNHDEGH